MRYKFKVKSKNLVQGIIALVVLLMGGLMSYYFLSTKVVSIPKDKEERVWTVKASKVLIGDFSPSIVLFGTLEAPDKATIRSALSADVHNVYYNEGDHVKKGEVLIRFDQRDFILNLKQREADLKLIVAKINALNVNQRADLAALAHENKVLALEKKSMARMETLLKAHHTSKESVDKAKQSLAKTTLSMVLRDKSVKNYKPQYNQLQAERAKANIMLEKAQLDLDRTIIKSPFSGIIRKNFVAVGDRVSPGSAMTSIKPLGNEEIRVQIPPRIVMIFLNALKHSQPISGEMNIHNKPYAINLDRISRNIESGKIGAEALFVTKGAAHNLIEGQVVSVRVSLPQISDVYAAPIQALYGNDMVYQLVKGRLSTVKIKRVGDQINKRGEHIMLFKSQDINRHALLLVSQLPNAYPGLKVQVIADKKKVSN